MNPPNGQAHIFNQRERRALFVGLDLETTCTDPSRARVVQFASIAHCPGFMPPEGSTANFLLDPGCAIPPSATAVHGITDEMVRGRLTFDENIPQLMQLLHMATQPGAIVTGYNVRRYDWLLLQHALAQRGIILPHPTFVDVCDLVGWYYRYLPSRKLSAVAEHLGVGFAASTEKQNDLHPTVGHVCEECNGRGRTGLTGDLTTNQTCLKCEGKGSTLERPHDALSDVSKTFQVLAKIRAHCGLSDDLAGDIALIQLAQLAAIRLDAEYNQYQHYIYRDRDKWEDVDAPFRLGFAIRGEHCGQFLTGIWRDEQNLWNWLQRKVVPESPPAVKEEFKRAWEIASSTPGAPRERGQS